MENVPIMPKSLIGTQFISTSNNRWIHKPTLLVLKRVSSFDPRIGVFDEVDGHTNGWNFDLLDAKPYSLVPLTKEDIFTQITF